MVCSWPREFRVPTGLTHGGTHVDEAGQAGVVTQEVRVHVHDQLVA